MRYLLFVFAVIVLTATAPGAWAFNHPGGFWGGDPFTINLYETADNTPNGTPAEVGPRVQLPGVVESGFLVLLEVWNTDPFNSQQNFDPSNWSDVLRFDGDTVQLFSDDANGQFPGTLVFEATYPGQNTCYTAEDFPMPYPPWYNAGGGNGTYVVWSDIDVPEPSSVLALITGLAGVGGMVVRRRK